MYKIEILSDTLRDAAIQRRKNLDEERKQRIFDPKIRVLGIDVRALEDQIRIKNEHKKAEREREAAFDKSMRQTNAILQHMDHEAEEQARANLHSLNQFRIRNQQPYQRREYDLYDPQALKNDLPARVADDDSRIGISSCQRFEGEDLASQERKRLQKQQMKTWSQEGMWERRNKQFEQAEEKRLYERYQNDIDQKVVTLQKAVNDARAEQARADKEYNWQLAELKREREAEERRHEEEQNVQEINRQVNGNFLTEHPDVFNIGGGHQVRVDMFKGMTAEQKRYIFEVQQKQREEAEARRENQRLEADRIARQEAANIRASMLLEREKARQVREEAVRLREENRGNAEEQKMKQYYMNRVLYTNKPTDDYFAQFNTTSR
ncbi:Protein Tax-1 [Geranomyces michiganensis]|nr:Protein Tax-1 [Geranomyces michiganensis]